MSDCHIHNVHHRAPEVEQMTVTKVTFYRGTGCCELSTIRAVTAYYDEDGQLIVELDMAMEAV
jgi:hypothetical protein